MRGLGLGMEWRGVARGGAGGSGVERIGMRGLGLGVSGEGTLGATAPRNNLTRRGKGSRGDPGASPTSKANTSCAGLGSAEPARQLSSAAPAQASSSGVE